jgi:hypothetical protein
LFHNKSVDKISIYSFGAQSKIKDFNFSEQLWNCYLSPADVIRQSREAQLNDTFSLSERIKKGEEIVLTIDENFKNAVSKVLDKLRLIANNLKPNKVE